VQLPICLAGRTAAEEMLGMRARMESFIAVLMMDRVRVK
jgi:hypothetical protein